MGVEILIRMWIKMGLRLGTTMENGMEIEIDLM